MKELNEGSKIDDLIKTSLERLKGLMETNTIVGEPIHLVNGSTIIPISKATVGFVVGGGEYSDKSTRRIANHFPMAGGSGCGMSVSPVGFLVISDSDVKFVDIENKTAYQTILNLVNTVLSKMTKNSNQTEAGDENNKNI